MGRSGANSDLQIGVKEEVSDWLGPDRGREFIDYLISIFGH